MSPWQHILSNMPSCARHLSSVGRGDAEDVAQCRYGGLQIELGGLGEVGLGREGERRGGGRGGGGGGGGEGRGGGGGGGGGGRGDEGAGIRGWGNGESRQAEWGYAHCMCSVGE